jgi:DNA polymerase V
MAGACCRCFMILATATPTGPDTVGLRINLQLTAWPIHSGFPSLAEDLVAKRIDFNEILVTHPKATFLFRVSGTSMKDAGIKDGDIVVVNRAFKPRHGCIALAAVDNDFTVKSLHSRHGHRSTSPGLLTCR